ncbi:hypothetical protein SCLCIDRAFT_653057 [Scleroderma citrinum Foug A]|uniref:Uncharacterized protein n=1 Tax=Scleroderma citrinum Foug A TaxID=1036808 RepID=A0A0C3D5G1_9AGAM|nr:hypothetical protein SCLCIDRAFT_653057 [Scleroderma citrinum Foug A]
MTIIVMEHQRRRPPGRPTTSVDVPALSTTFSWMTTTPLCSPQRHDDDDAESFQSICCALTNWQDDGRQLGSCAILTSRSCRRRIVQNF